MKQRMPRKLKKRIKKVLNSPEVKESLNEMSDALMTYGRAIKYTRLHWLSVKGVEVNMPIEEFKDPPL